MHRLSISMLLAGASLLAAHPAAAQSTAAPGAAPADTGAIGEIIVTAQRRAERLQDVPVSVMAVTGTALTASGVTNPQELATITPGLTVVFSRNTATPYLRGVGTQNAAPGDEGSVSNYIDGVYIAALSGTLMTFNNVQRVEVLKGPQGTLFGRNTTGGLVQVITAEPDGQTRVKGTVEYASYDTPMANVYATTGLTSTLSADIAAYYSDQNNGWGKQIATGKDINYATDKAIRSKLVWRPNDDVKVTLAGDWSRRDSDYGTIRQIYPGTRGFGGFVPTGDIHDSSSGLPSFGRADQYGGSLTVNYALGFADLTSITAIRHYFADYNFDQDSTPLEVVNGHFTNWADTYQQEFLLNGKTGRLTYTTGVFLFYEKDILSRPLTSKILPPFNSDLDSKQDTWSLAGYLQGTYAITDTTNLTLGGRFTHSTRDISGYFTGLPGGLQPVGAVYTSKGPGPYQQSITFDRATWRVALDHHFTDDIMVFASASEGFKDGIFNMADPVLAAVKPEVLRSYEGGIKSSFFDRRLMFNVSGFHYDYSNIQLTILQAGTTGIYNAASGNVDGVEVETVVRPSLGFGDLQISGNLSWLKAKYADFKDAPYTYLSPAVCTPAGPTPGYSTGPSAGGGITCAGDAGGNDMVNAPRVTLNVSAEYSFPVGPGNLVLNGSYYYNDGYYFNPDNRVKQGHYDLINARIAYEFGNWSVYFYGKNIGKTRYFNQLSSTNFGDAAVAGAPRTYGGGLSFTF